MPRTLEDGTSGPEVGKGEGEKVREKESLRLSQLR